MMAGTKLPMAAHRAGPFPFSNRLKTTLLPGGHQASVVAEDPAVSPATLAALAWEHLSVLGFGCTSEHQLS